MKNLKTLNKGLTLILFTALILTGCQGPVDVTDEITEANQLFMEAFNSGDAAKLAENYTSNAKLFPTNSDVIEGQEAIKNFWQGAIDMGIKKAVLETILATSFGNTANEEGRYTLYAENNVVADQGKYIVIWKKVSGQWKLHYDIWNTSNPAPQARAFENDTVWVVWNNIKANKVSQFEDFNFNYLEPAVAEYYPQIRNTVRTLKPVEPNKDGTFTYFYLIDPATSPDGYDMNLPLTAKYGKEKADEYLTMFTDCLKGGKQEWIVTVQTRW